MLELQQQQVVSNVLSMLLQPQSAVVATLAAATWNHTLCQQEDANCGNEDSFLGDGSSLPQQHQQLASKVPTAPKTHRRCHVSSSFRSQSCQSSMSSTIPRHASLWMTIRGGGRPRRTTVSLTQSDRTLSPQYRSVLWMALAMAFHYLGYSLARSISVALFTSSATGYDGAATAFSLAMTMVSPVSLFLLWMYTRILHFQGPYGALGYSTLFCALYIQLSAMGIALAGNNQGKMVLVWGIPVVKLITGPLFVFRESYVQLLTSQYWSFMASVLTPQQSAQWFGPIAGLTSIASVIAGVMLKPLVKAVGLVTALWGTAMMLFLSFGAATRAYRVADAHGFAPTTTDPARKKKPTTTTAVPSKQGLLSQAITLFRRVPVLKALFMEILASQGLATLLNVCFVTRVGTSIPNDEERAGWLGQYYALINIITMVLQFGVLPPLMSFVEPRQAWRVVPLVSLLCTGIQAFWHSTDPTLAMVSASLLVLKVSEYSVRRMLDEMIFVPLDFESRYLGKEILGVFGYRLGKSLMSLVLSAIACVDSNFGVAKQSLLAHVMCWTWLKTAWSLSHLVPTRQDEKNVQKKRRREKR